jgi:2-keto-myo-inositol isomerase
MRLSRRAILTVPAAAVAAGAMPAATGEPFGYCLNTSTIRGQKLGIVKEVETAAEAGYKAIEPWVGSIRKYQQSGGSLTDLRKRIADLGLKVPGAVSFSSWIVDDKARRAKALEQAKGEMDLVRQIGGTGIAAPPAGATRQTDLNLLAAAQRYRDLIEVGQKIGVVPAVELWGPSKSLSRIGEVVMVAIESGHKNACVLLDVYHIYKGGSNFAGLNLLGPSTMRVFHINDYPADPPRETITDAHRVHAGDGVAPLKQIFRTIKAIGFRGWLSLELFNREYYKQPALTVAKTGLAKMKSAVRAAGV